MKKILLLALLASSCVTSFETVEYGVREQHAGYVPARIAVLPCMVWPNGAGYKNLELSNIDNAELAKLCGELDKFVIKAFTDQPYMRGFSPKTVRKLLAASGNSQQLGKIETLWKHEEDSCRDCPNPPSYYVNTIQERKNWRLWLQTFSKNVRNSDALLVPFVTFAYQKRFFDRGLKVSKRAAAATILLIDTSNASLLWSGARSAFATEQLLAQANVEKEPQLPSWKTVHDRLLVDLMFKEFPGRQVYK